MRYDASVLAPLRVRRIRTLLAEAANIALEGLLDEKDIAKLVKLEWKLAQKRDANRMSAKVIRLKSRF